MNRTLRTLRDHLLRARDAIRIRACLQADDSFDLTGRHIESTNRRRCVFSAAEIPDIITACLKLRDIHLGNAHVPHDTGWVDTHRSTTGRVHLYSDGDVIGDADVMSMRQLPWRPADIGGSVYHSSA